VGATFALSQPFCSCCSSVMAPSFVRNGASTLVALLSVAVIISGIVAGAVFL